ncbi:helix-turn-helix domain-containing protein [Zunongwangia atlantica]|uniref:HTH_3 family transcriptional regulator protein n=1 Tax=Zunongwangia atlantica 22II14-10F7 TaxID=1185767 RepID=A0A1Y1SXS9_9FLAO|nr:helix-turn-helix transcriptional regulator [Zunongwangia atlantica]ORL43550.1 HTH_3 family transcriptional regulator protein [Zunongwangia atlantica 22II14-10F7]
MNIGTAVKSLRKERGFGQRELAEKCDISVNALSQIETNATFPHKKTIEKICSALNIPVSYLLFFSIGDEDIPEDKKEAFNYLNGAVKNVLKDSMHE